MSDSRAAAGAVTTPAALGLFKGQTGFVVTAVAVASVGVFAVALLAARTPQPFVMTLLGLLAALGLFFVFGVLAGQIRFTPRSTKDDATGAIVEHLHEGVQLTTRDGRILFSNNTMQAMAGGSIGQRAVDQLFAGEPDGEEAVFRLLRAAARGESHVEEFPVTRVPGGSEPGWISVMATPLDGTVGGTLGADFVLWRVADVTEAHRREIEARRTSERIIAGFDAMPAGMLIAAPDGAIVHMNDTLAGWLGLGHRLDRPADVKLADILAPESLALLAGHASPEAERFDLDFLAAGGRTLAATVVGSKDPAGHWSAIVHNRALVPAREPALSDAAGKRLFQAAPIGIATLDRDGRVVSANTAFAKMLLLPAIREQSPVLDLLAPASDQALRKAVEGSLTAALEGRASVPPSEITVGARGEFSRRVFWRPLTSANTPEAVIAYVVDVTEERALEEKYAQSQKMEAVGKLAGGIAHDFNNVLTAIIGWSDLLLGTQRPGDPAFQNVMNIKSSANRAAGMVNQLLAFSRRQTLQPEVLQLGEVLTELSVLLNRLLGEKVELKIHQGRDLWHVKADRSQFGQVMINLAVNARDAMPEGGKLSVRTRNVTERETQKLESQGIGIAAGEYVLIEVEDTGVGIEPQVLAKIFEPFFTTKGVGKGTGLGLSTVYGIVRQTGGFVFADSTPGKGTTFRVYLPRHVVEVEEEDAAAAKPARKTASKDLTGRGRVLLVEDEDAVRSFAIEALRRQGYEVFEACTGAEGLEVMKSIGGKVDIVVSDVIMPEMDGPTMLNELRKEHPDLKIIFMSGYPDDAFKTALADDAKFAFLPKPFSLAQLAAKVKDELTAV